MILPEKMIFAKLSNYVLKSRFVCAIIIVYVIFTRIKKEVDLI